MKGGGGNKEEIQKYHVSQQCYYQGLNPDYTICLFQVSGYLPNMHTELQKFAVALEAVIQKDQKSVSLNETYDYLIQVLAKSKLYSLCVYNLQKQDTSCGHTVRCTQSVYYSAQRSSI
jgi:hypothetical protein